MANPEHLDVLKSGRTEWNRWREEQPGGENAVLPDLSGADLSGLDLNGMNFFRASLAGAVLDNADLTDTDFMLADLEGAQFRGKLSRTRFYNADLTDASFGFLSILERAEFSRATLRRTWLNNVQAAGSSFLKSHLIDAHLCNAELTGADFTHAELIGADLTGANLAGANLIGATLVRTGLEKADLTGCRVYGISAWDVRLGEAKQAGLVITQKGEPEITVDDLEVAQFIYLLSRSEKLRKVIDTLGSKGVLIIGRFTHERVKVLHAIRDELRKRHDLLPIMFEFDPLPNKTTIETLLTLAHMSRFVIADLTDAKAVVQELTKIVDSLPSLPIKLIIHESADMPSMSESFRIKESVLSLPYVYGSQEELIKAIVPEIIEPANARAAQLEERLAEVRRESLPWQDTKKPAQ
jgi:uncharacterized protein YjbI with pentapeptide repeats